MSLPPYPAYTTTDSLQPRRVALVVLGLTATVIAFAECVALARKDRRDLVALAALVAVFVACAVVGWRSYPYWATGVYQVSIGAFPPRDQDPKNLIPMTWIGDLWRLPVLLLHLICYVTVPVSSVAAIVALWRLRFIVSLITAASISITLVFMLGFSPDYIIWLMD